jgi:superoxide reductase
MGKFGEVFQSADWKTEKHVPLIECADSVKSGELFDLKVTIGRLIF